MTRGKYNSGPEPLPIRAKEPRSSVSLNRKAVIVVGASLAFAVGYSICAGFSQSNENVGTRYIKAAKALPSEAVASLPSDYSLIKKEKLHLGPPLNGELGPTQLAFEKQTPQKSLSAEEKLLEEQKLQRLKQAQAARTSDVTFQSLRIETTRPNEGRSTLPVGALPSIDPAALGIPNQGSNRDVDNRQDDKRSFLKEDRSDASILPDHLHTAISPYEVLTGTVIPGVLLTGINSDLPGEILGQISQNIFDSVSGHYLLLPQGSKTIGEYDSRVSYGQERVLVVWTRLILPNGKSISLETMPGVDMSGYAGLKDKVNDHYGKLLSGVILGSLLGAGAQIAHGSNRTVDPSFSQLALEGTAQNINEAGQQITRKNLNIQPTLEIAPGQRFSIFVTKDLVLEPYKQ